MYVDNIIIDYIRSVLFVCWPHWCWRKFETFDRF